MADTLVDALAAHAAWRPDRPALTFLQDGEDAAVTWTYAALDRKARAIAAALQARVAPGARVLLLHPQGLDYVAALFGAMRAGVLAVPLQPPGKHRAALALPKLEAVLADGDVALALATAATVDDLKAIVAPSPTLSRLDWLATDTIPDDDAARYAPRELHPDDLAYLQYTSGSTSTPKGVMVSHANLIVNLTTFDQDFGHDDHSVLVSWLPVFHDLGLVYGVFMPLWKGFPGVLLDPLAFLQRPFRWVRAVHAWRGTHTCAPNFAFDLVAAKTTPEERARLDLSCWKVALNGAEPIRYESEARFVEAFAPCGVRWTTVRHAYGMSESTAVIAKEPVGTTPVFLDVDPAALERHEVVPSDASGARRIAGCGVPTAPTRVVAVEPDTREALPERRVGELWIGGPTRAQGYWHREAESADAFEARTTAGDGPFLRTGDLGFLHDGQVFVTGRLKDLLIVRGENHYPQDVEWSVQEAHPAIRPSCVAAFAVEHGATEGVGIVAEVLPDKAGDVDAVLAAVREAVGGHGLQARVVALVPPKAVFKTSSGKIMRRRTREALLDGSLDVVARWEAGEERQAEDDAIATRLAAAAPADRLDLLVDHVRLRAAALLGLDTVDVDPDLPLRELGLDSVQAVDLVDALGRDLGLDLPALLVFDVPTVGALARRLEADLAGKVKVLPRPAPAQATDDLDGATADELAALLADELKDL